MPRPTALVVAGAIAAVALRIALEWSSELVAGLGLVGAILVPATVAQDVSPLGTAFVAFVFAAAIVVAVHERWPRLLDVAAVAAVAQAWALVVEANGAGAGVLAVTAAFWLLLLATSVAWQWRLGIKALSARTATYAVASAAFASLSAAWLFGGTAEWATLLGVALASLALAVALVQRERFREPGALVLAIALAVGGIVAADALSRPSLSVVWAAEGALLMWLAARTRELRFELAGFVYLAMAAVHALAVEAAPDLFSRRRRIPRAARRAPPPRRRGHFASVFAGRTRKPIPEQGVLRHLAPELAAAHRNVRARRESPFHGGALLCLYAGALGILGLFQLGHASVQAAFEHGQVVVTAGWAAAALAAILAAPALPILREAGYVWLALVKLVGFDVLQLPDRELVGFDVVQLPDRELAASALAVGAGALVAAQVDARRFGSHLEPVSAAALGVTVPCLFVATVGLTGGDWHGVELEGAALLGLAGVYLALAAVDLRPRRDFATALWAIGLGIAAVGSGALFDGSWLVLAWRGCAADALFPRPQPSGGRGRRALVAVADAALVVARFLLPHPLEPRVRRVLVVGASVLAVYAGSLGLLELFERLGSAGVQTSFQCGHTAVSTFWALIGVAFLHAGLVRRRRSLRLGGLALLVAGFFYQRLNADGPGDALAAG